MSRIVSSSSFINLLSMLMVITAIRIHADEFSNTDNTLRSEDFTENIFEKIYIDGTNAVFVFHSEVRSFLYYIDNGPAKQAGHAEKVHVPIGSTFFLLDRHMNIKFSLLPSAIKDAGFHAQMTFDNRSANRGMTKKDGYLIFPDRLDKKSPASMSNRSDRVIITEPSVDKVRRLVKESGA
jgi:hypothetical protein